MSVVVGAFLVSSELITIKIRNDIIEGRQIFEQCSNQLNDLIVTELGPIMIRHFLEPRLMIMNRHGALFLPGNAKGP